jgi:8-oxo-dGTP pyrophosphatase MutT (NUDIX family)
VLFVRHTYGNRRAWELPGGGAHRSESVAETARREAREELGVDIADWRELGTVQTGRARGRLTLTCLDADWPPEAVLDPDPVEIAAAAWHALDAPPSPLGRITADAMPLL